MQFNTSGMYICVLLTEYDGDAVILGEVDHLYSLDHCIGDDQA